MSKPWLAGELAYAVGMSMLGEDWETIAIVLGRPVSDFADAMTVVRDTQLFVQWSERVEALNREEKAKRDRQAAAHREKERLASIPKPRISEQTERPGRYIPRRFAPKSHFPPAPKTVTATLMGDPAPGRSALAKIKER